MSPLTGKRIYFRAKNPNPLFTEWLEYWVKQAEEKDSMKKYALAKALESLKKYPLVLYTGRDCAILEGFGSGICSMIDKQLQVYRDTNPGRLLDEQQMDVKEKSIILDVKTAFEKKRAKRNPIKDFKEKLDDTLEALLNDNAFDEDIYMIPPVMTQPIPQMDFMPEKVRLGSCTFKIILLVDTQETAGKSKRQLDTTLKALEQRKVNFEVRRLSVGDFLWICRDETNKEHELVLPYIIERKRMDDLASSIKDGRFHEQKFRLSDCGLHNRIYMIENRGNNTHVGLPLTNLLQATTNTLVQNGFIVKFTDSNENSMFYLSVMSNLLIKMYAKKDLVHSTKTEIDRLPANYYSDLDAKSEVELIDFKEFSKSTGKMRNFTIRDMFNRQLVSLKSLSIDKALAITEIYPTPRSLISAYDRCFDEKEAMNLLADISCGKLKRPLGTTISQTIYKLFNASSYE
ncbi:crossover junction endonuclease MUS81 [Sitodiplosis mosellana]|uniref:crossover junction endonuclease MUS81 n=1 Tax=Sitodiplosis mosellana TaxID=263140 RepID=UPI0024449F15|nr:crossover junction endonuclease MUS81 [Sitodiplosis mosellana]